MQQYKKNILIYVSVLVLLILYFIEIKVFGFAIPCLINTITGFKCPGCGITHMLMAISHLDFKGAFYYNPFIFVTSPLILYFFIKDTLYQCGFIKSKIGKTENIILYVYVVLFILYGIVRNVI